MKSIFAMLLALSFSCGGTTVVPDCPACPDQSAKSACTEFIFSMCEKMATCTSQLDVNACEKSLLPSCAGFDDLEKEQVPAFYDECIGAIGGMTCELMRTEGPIPPQCMKYLEDDDGSSTL